MSTIVASEPEAGMPAELRLVAKKLNSADRAESRRSQFGYCYSLSKSSNSSSDQTVMALL